MPLFLLSFIYVYHNLVNENIKSIVILWHDPPPFIPHLSLLALVLFLTKLEFRITNLFTFSQFFHNFMYQIGVLYIVANELFNLKRVLIYINHQSFLEWRSRPAFLLLYFSANLLILANQSFEFGLSCHLILSPVITAFDWMQQSYP